MTPYCVPPHIPQALYNIQAVSVRVRARTRTRAGAAHSVRSVCADLVPAVRAMCV